MRQIVAEDREQTDEGLARRVGRADSDALAELYERHVEGLYDFAAWNLGDREFASDVVQDTFVKAWEHLQRGEIPRNVRAWLYTIARNRAIDEHRRRRREVPTATRDADDDRPDHFAKLVAPETSEPESMLADKDMVDLFWSSAEGLSVDERSLLDLHLRRGLSADELAETLELSKGAVYTRLSRLKDSIERSVAATVLVRRGRGECSELDALLTSSDASDVLAAQLTREVEQHAASCKRCLENRKRFVSAEEMFGALPLFTPSASEKHEMWDLVSARLEIQARPRADERPPKERLHIQALLMQLLVCAAVAVLAAWALTWPARSTFDEQTDVRDAGWAEADFPAPPEPAHEVLEPPAPPDDEGPSQPTEQSGSRSSVVGVVGGSESSTGESSTDSTQNVDQSSDGTTGESGQEHSGDQQGNKKQ